MVVVGLCRRQEEGMLPFMAREPGASERRPGTRCARALVSGRRGTLVAGVVS